MPFSKQIAIYKIHNTANCVEQKNIFYSKSFILKLIRYVLPLITKKQYYFTSYFNSKSIILLTVFLRNFLKGRYLMNYCFILYRGIYYIITINTRNFIIYIVTFFLNDCSKTLISFTWNYIWSSGKSINVTSSAQQPFHFYSLSDRFRKD